MTRTATAKKNRAFVGPISKYLWIVSGVIINHPVTSGMMAARSIRAERARAFLKPNAQKTINERMPTAIAL